MDSRFSMAVAKASCSLVTTTHRTTGRLASAATWRRPMPLMTFSLAPITMGMAVPMRRSRLLASCRVWVSKLRWLALASWTVSRRCRQKTHGNDSTVSGVMSGRPSTMLSTSIS